MPIDPDKMKTEESSSLGEPKGFARLSQVVDWAAADKSLLISGIVFCLHLYVISLLHLARAHNELLPFLDPSVVDQLIEFNYMTVGAWGLLGLSALALRRKHGDLAFFEYAGIQLFAISNAVYAYFLGFFTEPFGYMTLIGGMMVGLPLFGRLPTLAGLVSWLSLFGTLTILEQMRLIPYAPLLQSSPVIDGQLSTYWLLGMNSINLTGAILTGVFIVTVIGLLQNRDKLRMRNQLKLLEVVGNLSDTTAELEEAGRKLELRVDERTLELKAANRNLQFEIGEREKSAKELNSIRVAMESAIEGVARVGADGRIQSANAAFLAMHGADSNEMLGSVANGWIEEADRSDVVQAILGLVGEGKAELSVSGRRSDGTDFFQVVAVVKVADGSEGGHYRFARDMTRQNELSNQLNHAMKMEAIGHLAGGIAHDFNNLLMAILTASERLQEFFGDDPSVAEQSEMADMISMAGTRAAALTAQLLDFAHLQPPSVSSIDINKSLEGVLELLAPALGESVEVVSQLSSERLFTSGDLSRFESGLLNVALNARDAMPEGGCLVIKTEAVEIDLDDPAFASFQPKGSKHARISFVDNGSGMDAKVMAQVFDPFFTTKPAGKGTGLGLSVFSTYVREIGGALNMSSRPGEGTTCLIHMPLSEQTEGSVNAGSLAADAGGNETVLLAEDEDIVARATTMLLSHSGYNVIRCADGLEAVNAFRERRDEIDLVLLDYRMPVMTGAEAFLELRRMDPGVPVILMSGNISLTEFSELEKKGLRAVLRKPCSRLDLTTAVREGIDSRVHSS